MRTCSGSPRDDHALDAYLGAIEKEVAARKAVHGPDAVVDVVKTPASAAPEKRVKVTLIKRPQAAGRATRGSD